MAKFGKIGMSCNKSWCVDKIDNAFRCIIELDNKRFVANSDNEEDAFFTAIELAQRSHLDCLEEEYLVTFFDQYSEQSDNKSYECCFSAHCYECPENVICPWIEEQKSWAEKDGFYYWAYEQNRQEDPEGYREYQEMLRSR